MNSTFFKIVKYVGFLLLAGISTWWTATSIYISGQQSTPLFVWIAVFFILSLIAAYIGFKGVKSQFTTTDNPSIAKLCGFFLVWLIFWAFSFATNVHRNVISQYGFNNVNAQLQSCKQYVENELSSTTQTSENTRKGAKDEISAKVEAIKQEFHRNMNNTKATEVGFADECIKLLNKIEDLLTSTNSIYHDPTIYVVYDDKNDAGDYGKKDYASLRQLQTKYDKRITDALLAKHTSIEKYYMSAEKSTKLLNELKTNIEKFEKSREFANADESKDVEKIYKCYMSLKKNVIDKMPEGYKTDIMAKDEKGKERYVVYPSDRMFNCFDVWSDWWNNRLPKDISLTGQFWLSFLIDFATYLLV